MLVINMSMVINIILCEKMHIYLAGEIIFSNKLTVIFIIFPNPKNREEINSWEF